MAATTLTAVTCLSLLIAVVTLWLQGRVWIAALAVTLLFGYLSHLLQGLAIVWIALLGLSAWQYPRQRLLAIPIVAITVLLGMHALPGFNNPLLAQGLVLSPGAEPFTLYFNFDKTIAGVLLIGACGIPLLKSQNEWRHAIRSAAPIVALNIVVAMLLSLAFGYVKFQPKWTAFFWTWATVNLLLTCLSEEAFFRGFIQRELDTALAKQPWGSTAAVAASSILFGCAHFAGGWSYVLLATIAGAGYGLVYQRSRSIELAMLAHFALNATHFLLFTYPRLA